MKTRISAIAAMVLALGLAGCGDTERTEPSERAGTDDGRQEYIVLAPGDAAFEALLSDVGMRSGERLSDAERVTAVLLYGTSTVDRSLFDAREDGRIFLARADRASPGDVVSGF